MLLLELLLLLLPLRVRLRQTDRVERQPNRVDRHEELMDENRRMLGMFRMLGGSALAPPLAGEHRNGCGCGYLPLDRRRERVCGRRRQRLCGRRRREHRRHLRVAGHLRALADELLTLMAEAESGLLMLVALAECVEVAMERGEERVVDALRHLRGVYEDAILPDAAAEGVVLLPVPLLDAHETFCTGLRALESSDVADPLAQLHLQQTHTRGAPTRV